MVTAFEFSKDPRLGPGSLWAAMPIPAAKALANAGEKAAIQVLSALIIHADGRSSFVFPKVNTIEKYVTLKDTSIKKATNTLMKFGFIKVKNIKTGRTFRYQYEILRACYHFDEFNEVASRYKVPKGLCCACRNWVYGNEWYTRRGTDRIADIQIRIHKNCGGQIKDLTKAQLKQIQDWEESAGMPN
jgi:hypothetical protein